MYYVGVGTVPNVVGPDFSPLYHDVTLLDLTSDELGLRLEGP